MAALPARRVLPRSDLEARFVALSRRVDDHVATLGIPGAAIGVIYEDWQARRAFGVASIAASAPMTTRSAFRIASLTKVVTATAVMRLVDKDLLSLDTPLSELDLGVALPDIAERASVSVRHLLTHTAGWMDDPLMEIDLTRDPRALQALPQLVPPGTHWSYSTTAFFLAGRIVERVTGQPFAAAMRELVLAPLGMTSSGVVAGPVDAPMASGHQTVGGALELLPSWGSAGWDAAAQGMYSSVDDLMLFCRAHLDGLDAQGHRFLSSASLQAMRAPQVLGGLRGLGWVRRLVDGFELYGHPGGMYGYACDVMLCAEPRFAIVVATNVGTHELDRQALPWSYELFLGAIDALPALLDRAPADLAQYAGRYVALSRDLLVSVDDGELRVQVVRDPVVGTDGVSRPARPRPMRLRFYGPERVVVVDGPNKGDTRGEFIRDDDGQIVLFRFPTLLHVREGSRIPVPPQLRSRNRAQTGGPEADAPVAAER